MNANRVNATPLSNTSGFYSRMEDGMANCIKSLGIGSAAAAAIISPLGSGSVFVAKKVGLIDYLAQKISPFASVPQIKVSKTSSFLEQAAQYHSQHSKPALLNFVVSGGLMSPIVEEVLYRGIIQGIILNEIPKYIIKKISPGKEIALDSTTAKVLRITFTAALFSASHLTNIGVMSSQQVSAQVVSSFVGGIFLGMLKESEVGLLGSMGAHIAHNLSCILS